LTVYYGWEIHTHVGKPNPTEIPDLKRKMKSWFSQEGWEYEDDGRILIYSVKIDEPIQVFFKDITTEQEESMGLRKYGIVIKSEPFSLRNDYAHKQVCFDVLSKIPWKKQAYFLTNNGLIPVHTPCQRLERIHF